MVKSYFKKNIYGQAMVEYLLILALMSTIGVRMVKMLSGFMNDSIGNMSMVVQTHLNVGVCTQQCFFAGYKNGKEN
jgi:Flp pilus assembly pilin Flp